MCGSKKKNKGVRVFESFLLSCLCFKLLSNINLFFQIINPFLCLFVNHHKWFHTPTPANSGIRSYPSVHGPGYTVIFKYSFIFGLIVSALKYVKVFPAEPLYGVCRLPDSTVNCCMLLCVYFPNKMLEFLARYFCTIICLVKSGIMEYIYI